MSHLCPSQQLLDVRRYNPKNDFHSALGDGDEDLDLLPPQAARGKSKLCMISRANWKALDPMHDAFPLDVAAAYRSRMPSHSWSEILRCWFLIRCFRWFESMLSMLFILGLQATVFFFCELASLHSALQEDELSGLLLWRALGSCKRRLMPRAVVFRRVEHARLVVSAGFHPMMPMPQWFGVVENWDSVEMILQPHGSAIPKVWAG